MTTKLCLYECLIKPIALFGCETWTMKKADSTKLQAFEMKCLRMLLGVKWSDHVNNEVALAYLARLETYSNQFYTARRLGWVMCVEWMVSPRTSESAPHQDRKRGGATERLTGWASTAAISSLARPRDSATAEKTNTGLPNKGSTAQQTIAFIVDSCCQHDATDNSHTWRSSVKNQ